MKSHTFEFKRQSLHVLLGIIILSILLNPFLSPQDSLVYAQAFVSAFLLYLLVLIDRREKNLPSPLADYLLYSFERMGAPPAHGAMWYAIGSLIALTFVSDIATAASIIFLVGIADGLSTIVGVRGRHPLPHNKKKTLEGTLAFFSVGLGAYAFIGPIALFLSALGAFTESMDLQFDDNLTVPLVCVVFFKLIGL